MAHRQSVRHYFFAALSPFGAKPEGHFFVCRLINAANNDFSRSGDRETNTNHKKQGENDDESYQQSVNRTLACARARGMCR
jgi:hypothetical protein